MKGNEIGSILLAAGPWVICALLAACGTVEDDAPAEDDAGESAETADPGGDDAGADDGTGGGGDVENVRQRIRDALCAAHTTCCVAAPDSTPQS
jgi:hypothetical protein